jgi:hypothetical protein
MSLKQIIQESINRSPLTMKEAFQEELRSRVALALEARMSEETEQLDELSPSTLHRYIKKSSGDLVGKSIMAASGKSDPTTKKATRKVGYRLQGISNASKKLADKADR